jgi:hypothetical protein
MPNAEKTVRQSVSLPSGVARRVRSLAKANRTSANRVLVDLIETGLQARDAERLRFLALADQLAASQDEKERVQLKAELARMTFGD